MDELDKQIREIKISRSPEAYLDDILMNLTEYIHNNYPNSTFYKKENDLFFEYNSINDCFYYHYDKIYLFLKEKYHCNDLKINDLIKRKVEEHLKLKVKTTQLFCFSWRYRVEEHLKLKVKTTSTIIYPRIYWVEEHLKLKVKSIYSVMDEFIFLVKEYLKLKVKTTSK